MPATVYLLEPTATKETKGRAKGVPGRVDLRGSPGGSISNPNGYGLGTSRGARGVVKSMGSKPQRNFGMLT